MEGDGRRCAGKGDGDIMDDINGTEPMPEMERRGRGWAGDCVCTTRGCKKRMTRGWRFGGNAVGKDDALGLFSCESSLGMKPKRLEAKVASDV